MALPGICSNLCVLIWVVFFLLIFAPCHGLGYVAVVLVFEIPSETK